MKNTIYGNSIYASCKKKVITPNQLALIYAIISKKKVNSDKALRVFGISPTRKDKKINEHKKTIEYKKIGQATYILVNFCNMCKKDAAAALNVNVQQVYRALRFMSYTRTKNNKYKGK